MTGLHIVRKRITESPSASPTIAGRALRQLAALDRARDSIHQAHRHLLIAADRAAKLYSKIQGGAESFLATWNVAHPDQTIQQCRGVASNSTCLRYTMNEGALCDSCRSKRGTCEARDAHGIAAEV